MHTYLRRYSLIMLLLALAVALALLLVGVIITHAETAVVAWDNSTITLTGQCLPSGVAEFTVKNTGQDMAGPSDWREYEADVLTTSGLFQLVAGGARTWTFASNGVPIEFQADQRPEHPGSSHPKLTLTCSKPTAVTLSSFSVSSAGNRGGCAEGNKWQDLPCIVTDFRPGFVNGTCDGGLWFQNIPTRRTFRIDQFVTVQGCEGEDWQLFSAPGWPFRIAR